MKSYNVKLIEKKEVAAGTMSFHFEKPKNFKYLPGQYALFSLIDPKFTDIKGNTRAMSLASAPSENEVSMAMRMSDSAYKRSLTEMEIGTEVEMQGPLGHLHLEKNDTRPVVFLAGGIGIVPFRSMLAEMKNTTGFNRDTTLVYSNRLPEDTTYYNELIEYGKNGVKIVCTASDKKSIQENWKHERGRISFKMLTAHINNPKESVYYIVGVPQMVKSMQDILEKMGVPAESVMIELFGGY